MEHNNIPHNKVISNLTNEELHEMALSYETFDQVEAIIKDNPKFKDMTFIELKNSEEFQEAFKEYRASYPITSSDAELEALISIIPKTFAMTNNKLSNEMTKDFVNRKEISLAVINVGKKGEIRTYNSLTYDDKNISIAGGQDFTAYDRAIHNAVCSLYISGNDIVTPSMVYRAVNGMSEQEKVSPQSMESVINSLDKSRSLKLKVDFTDEAKARRLNVDETTIESHLLVADKIKVKAGNNVVEAYKIFRIPILYQYAQYTKQIISIPSGLLDTKEATRNTEEIIPIKEYLIRRIEVMKHDKIMNKKIIYDTIFEEVGISVTNRVQKERLRNYIKSILELWKTRDNYFKNFKEYTERNSAKGIEIFF